MTNPVTIADGQEAHRDDGVDHAPRTPGTQTWDVCIHAAAGHDPISRRYCAATLTNALTRSCICS
jgi:hypothetical protein